MPTLKRIMRVLDAITLWMAKFSCWLVLPLMAVLVYEVLVRKFFISPTTWAMDTSYMLTGALGMAGAVYALNRGSHISIDFFSRRWSVRTQAALNAVLYVLCFFPGLGIFLWFGWKFAYNSWLEGERAITSAWMPPIYPLKMVMAVGTALLILQGISELLKNLHVFFRGDRP